MAPPSERYGQQSIDVGGEAFATRLANLLRARRRETGSSRRALARRSDGRFGARDLRRAEAGTLRPEDATELAALYGADLAEILPTRIPVEVDPDGRVATAGVVEEFEPGDPDQLLTAYLRLVRRLRRAEREPVVALRRDDVQVLAGVLQTPSEQVVDRLGALMGVTRAQRQVMVGLLVSGAVVVGLAVTAVAATNVATDTGSGDDPGGVPTAPPGDGSTPAATDAPAEPDGSDTGAADPAASETSIPGAPDTGSPETSAPETGPPATVVVDEEWTGPVAPPSDLDVSPLPPATTVPPATTAPPATAPPATAPPVTAPPSTAPPTTAPPTTEQVEVGPPPVPTTAAPRPRSARHDRARHHRTRRRTRSRRPRRDRRRRPAARAHHLGPARIGPLSAAGHRPARRGRAGRRPARRREVRRPR